MTFGNFNARLHAGRDIGGSEFGVGMPGVWAKGNITGVIDANRNVGGYGDQTVALFDSTRYPVIFAGGQINADIYARNTSHQPTGGRIGSVGAHGSISGLFKAQSSIDEVFSAGNIDAILDAPVVAGIRENDPSVITDHPLPATPESVKPEVLADAAAVHAEVLADRDAVFAAKDDLFAAIAALEAEVHDDVAKARVELAEATARTAARAAESLEDRRQGVADAFAKLRAAAARTRDAALSEAESSRERFAEKIAAEARGHQTARAQAQANKQQQEQRREKTKKDIDTKRTEALNAAARLDAARINAWKKHGISLAELAEKIHNAQMRFRGEYLVAKHQLGNMANSSDPVRRKWGLYYQDLAKHMTDAEFLQFVHDLEQGRRAYEFIMDLFATITPGLNFVVAGYKYFTGKDLAGNDLGEMEAILNGVFFLAPFATAGAAIVVNQAQRVSRFGKGFSYTQGAVHGSHNAKAVFEMQKQLSRAANRQARVVDKWLSTSNSRLARFYRGLEKARPNSNLGKMIRGRVLDHQMRKYFRRKVMSQFPGQRVRVGQTIPGSGSLKPDLYIPNLGGNRTIFEVAAGPSKIKSIHKYEGMADFIIPIIPAPWL